MTETERAAVVQSSMERIWAAKDELKSSAMLRLDRGASSQDLSMLLLVRMITRVLPGEQDKEDVPEDPTDIAPVSKQERVRQTLFDYILTDFPSR